MPKAEDALLVGKVVTNSIGMPTTLWAEVDKEVVLLGKKSRSALITEIVYEALVVLRAGREKAKK